MLLIGVTYFIVPRGWDVLDICGEFPKMGIARGVPVDKPPKRGEDVEKSPDAVATGCCDLRRPRFDRFPNIESVDAVGASCLDSSGI